MSNSDVSRAGGPVERDIEQAITALKKGAYLLKYGRRGKPKFCPFRLAIRLWKSFRSSSSGKELGMESLELVLFKLIGMLV
ncbi:UNVERIFIED_CONTAM: PH, RCC1 and FYVE domains-containing protein 1 [Sesamum radiatum]|uniref:PH, RCC1 and FYVE domains-containing protein 1 n=1 Tax=Sesamum radiatum TaxID=300843 RepID=A0AAW2UQD7_SESRA